ncbi:RNA-splicing factor [Recurvomyces mirabilis]|uniref:Pre-mRNA-splicing factor CWC24 n=1 Tax=Recurvomyces mirabilis TaxID=574656 RepID=A0AAE1C377_9PEZI|nr:RNA-splicing factor [Recurvomyces mirabilis]KAK5153945.1 RNA-splicing factor [Recurvomyces mirabilis]
MADVAPPAFKKRANKNSNIRKRPATTALDDSASESDYTDDDEAGIRVKRRRKEGVKVVGETQRQSQTFSKSTAFEADRTKVITANDDATKSSNWYNEASNAAETVRATARHLREEKESGDDSYKGSSKYSDFIQKDTNGSSRQVGPVKTSTNVRMITVTDFAPDVCKDYKQTGFCGFGDNCKYLHIREDFKQGWQLDKEWEKAGKDKKPGKKPDEPDSEEKMLENIPFKCIICKEDYKRPIVTKCGHYFCEKCAMVRYMKEKKKGCANCGVDTGGTFNVARRLKELLERKREREEAKQKEEEGGEGGEE